MAETKYTTSAKILKWMAYIFMGIAMLLIFLGFSGLWWGPILPGLDPLYMLILGFLLLLVSAPLLVMAQAGAIKPEFNTISLVRCSNAPDCKFIKGRPFEKDEYVFKDLDEKCEKCNSPLYIAAIFEIERKQKEPKKEKSSEKTEKQEESWEIKDENPKN